MIIPLRQTPTWTTRSLKISDNLNEWGIPQNETESSTIREDYNLGERSTLVTQFHCSQALKKNMVCGGLLDTPGNICWLESPG